MKAGILTLQEADEKWNCMTGEQFEREIGGVECKKGDDGLHYHPVNATAFKNIANRLKVMARATPEQKFMLVACLRESPKVVAVTGESHNDAKALAHADIGFTMGQAGCSSAKDAADMILMTDNFASTMNAVRWGRNMFNNIRKFLQFQLTVNMSCVFIVLLSSLSFGQSVFPVIQLLWINLIMDTFAALALATEPPHATILKGRPVRPYDKLMSPIMWRTILGQTLWQMMVMITLLYAVPAMFKIEYDWNNVIQPIAATETTPAIIGTVGEQQRHFTIVFNAFIHLQIFNEFCCRKLGVKEFNIFQGFFNNWLFLAIVAGTAAAQWAWIYVIPQAISQCAELAFWEYMTGVFFGLGTWGVDAILKATPPELCDKIPFSLNESATFDNDPMMSAFKNATGQGLQKSHTQKLSEDF